MGQAGGQSACLVALHSSITDARQNDMDQGWTEPLPPSAAAPARTHDRPLTHERERVPDPGARSARGFRLVLAGLGLIWLVNAGFQLSAWIARPELAGATALQHVLAAAGNDAPPWLRPTLLGVTASVRIIGVEHVAFLMVAIALLLGLALLTQVGLRPAAWLGIGYSLVCWVVLCALGYPYGHGQTDPGVFPAYLIAFIFVLAVAPPAAGAGPDSAAPRAAFWTAGRMLFGVLWAFDAALKWEPYFLTHFLDQLTPAAVGQPGWIAAYIGVVIVAVKAIGPVPSAIATAVVETAIAVSLLTGRLLRWSVPLGLLYALAVWTTAEGWGGPYTSTGTGVRGNVLGNVLIYAVIFLFLLAPQLARTAEGHRAQESA